jgi:hypothetical protein
VTLVPFSDALSKTTLNSDKCLYETDGEGRIGWLSNVLLVNYKSTTHLLCVHAKSCKKMQNRHIAQNATLSKIFTAFCIFLRMFTAQENADERHLHSDWLAVI